MKSATFFRNWVIAFSISALFTSCIKDEVTKTYTIYKPVFARKSEVLAGIRAGESVAAVGSGKIYLYGHWIFMNEPGKGIHIFDNLNPSAPYSRAFIKLPGNIDIAVKGNTLYADLFADLLTIDISDPLKPVLKKVIPNAFPDRPFEYGYPVDSSMIIVDWVAKDTVVKVSSGDTELVLGNCPSCMLAQPDFKSGGQGGGKGGSMSRFAIVNDYLYTVSRSQLSTHDITNQTDPVPVNSVGMGWNIETIYPFRDKLFIGSNSGMFIADISHASNPTLIGQFLHASACDPVVADDSYAYVTLRAGNFCMGIQNQLDIIDIANLQAPKLIKSYPMTNPHGLAVLNNFLYVCDGKAGLKVYQTSDKENIQEIQQIPVAQAVDVILNSDILLLVAEDGLYQYRIDENGKLSELSNIKLK